MWWEYKEEEDNHKHHCYKYHRGRFHKKLHCCSHICIDLKKLFYKYRKKNQLQELDKTYWEQPHNIPDHLNRGY